MKMKLKTLLLICILVFIAILPFISAEQYSESTNPYNATLIYHFNETAGTVLVDSMGKANGTTSNAGDFNQYGKWGYSVNYSGNHGDVPIRGGPQSWTVSFWFYVWQDIGGTNNIMGDADNNYLWYLAANNSVGFYMCEDGGCASPNTLYSLPLNDSSWHHIVGILNTESDYMSLYIDSVLTGNVSTSYGASGINWFIGCRNSGGVPQACEGGHFDDLLFFNGTVLTPAQILVIYEESYPSSTGITWTYPLNNTQYNVDSLPFNFSFANITDSTNCSLWQNDTFKQLLTGLTNDTKYNFSVSYPAGTIAPYLYFINCTNGTTSATSEERIIYIDRVFPYFQNMSFTNDSYVFIEDNITGNFSCYDTTILHSFNVSIDATSVYGNNSVNSTSFNYTLNYNVSSFGTGIHNLSIRCADGHTGKKLLGDYEVDIGLLKNKITFKFDKPYNLGSVSIKSDNIFDTFSAEKQTDRYIFDFKPNSIEDNYNFEIESSFNVHILTAPNSPYKKWIVVDNHWLDFVPEGCEFDIDMKRINANKVNVKVSGLEKQEEYSFQSIGDLNIISANYSFFVFNYTETYLSPIMETTPSNFTLSVNFDGDYMDDINATFYWNETAYAPSRTATATYINFSETITTELVGDKNMTFYWAYNITGKTNNSYNTTQRNQSIFMMRLDNCSTYTMRTMNFSMWDEETDARVSSDVELRFRIRYSANILYRNVSFKFSNHSNFSICIYPEGSNLTTNATIIYSAPEYSTREYYLVNAVLTNQTTLIPLYLLNDTTGTLVYLITKDSVLNPIDNVIIKINRWYVGPNVYKLVEETKTDAEGYAVSHLIQNDVNYKFIFEKNGVLLDSTFAKRVACTSTPCTKEFFITDATIDFYEGLEGITGFSYYTTWNNNTKMLGLTYNDVTGVTPVVTFAVKKDAISGVVTVCNSSLTSTSGSIYCNLSAYDEGTFSWWGYRATNPTSIFAWGSFTMDEIWKTFGVEGAFWSWIFLMSVAAAGLFSAGAAIFMIIFGSVILTFLHFTSLTYYIVALIIIAGVIILALMRKNRGIY